MGKLVQLKDGEENVYPILDKNIIMVSLSGNRTIPATSGTIYLVPYDQIRFNIGNKFTLHEDGRVLYSGNRPIKATFHVSDNGSSSLLYLSVNIGGGSGYIGTQPDLSVGDVSYVNYGDSVAVQLRFPSASGEIRLRGTQLYTYLIVEEL